LIYYDFFFVACAASAMPSCRISKFYVLRKNRTVACCCGNLRHVATAAAAAAAMLLLLLLLSTGALTVCSADFWQTM